MTLWYEISEGYHIYSGSISIKIYVCEKKTNELIHKTETDS